MKKYFFIPIAFALSVTINAQQNQQQAKWEKEYDNVDACTCGLAKVEKNGKHGL